MPPKLCATSDSQHYHRTRRYDGSCAVTRTSKNKSCLWLRVPKWVGVDWKHREICDVSNIPWELSHINSYINDLWTKTIALISGGIPECVGTSVVQPHGVELFNFQTPDLWASLTPMSKLAPFSRKPFRMNTDFYETRYKFKYIRIIYIYKMLQRWKHSLHQWTNKDNKIIETHRSKWRKQWKHECKQ